MSIVRKYDHKIAPMSEERVKEIQAMSDEDLDFSDIPELGEAFFQNGKLVKRKLKAVSIRVDTETLK